VNGSSPPPKTPPALTAEILRSHGLDDLEMRAVAGETGMARAVSWGRIQRPGLALAGFIPYIKPGRIQILGESELNYLDTMPADVRRELIDYICALPIAAFVGRMIRPEIKTAAVHAVTSRAFMNRAQISLWLDHPSSRLACGSAQGQEHHILLTAPVRNIPANVFRE
jgi:hypothetical protein